jgi:hypothetical protein
VPCFDFVFALGRGACFFFGRPAEEAALVLQDGLSATMEMSLSSELFFLLLLLICSSIGDKKGVLRVNHKTKTKKTPEKTMVVIVFFSFLSKSTKKRHGSEWSDCQAVIVAQSPALVRNQIGFKPKTTKSQCHHANIHHIVLD